MSGIDNTAVQPIFGLTAEDLTDRDAVVEKLLDALY